MDPTGKIVHVEVVGQFLVFDTDIRSILKWTAPGIRGGNWWCAAKV